MSFRTISPPPSGRSATRWFLFLSFYHLLPMIWYLAVIGGLAPASFLLAGGIASLFSGDSDGFAFAAFLLAPALLGGLIEYLAAWLLAWLIGRMRRPLARTLTLLLLLSACLAAATRPIFISGGHGSSHAYSLFDFAKVLAEFRVPESYVTGYFSGLALLLLALLIYQHLVARQQTISAQKWLRRRRFRRRLVAAGLLILLLSVVWTHRTLLFVKPLADFGFASAQYHLAMTLKEESILRHGRPGSDYQEWLVKAAEQGHLGAARELVLQPRDQEERLRWLTVAAEGGMADAQYLLYRELLKASPTVESTRSAADWLRSAADNGQAEAQFDLGYALLHGLPQLEIDVDPGEARRWWELAADNGHRQAMRELAWRYEQAADGFPRNARRAIELHRLMAESYQAGDKGLPQDQLMATRQLQQAAQLTELETKLAAGDPQAQAELGRTLLQVAGGSAETRAEGVRLLELAASQGDPELQFELGGIFLFGRNDQAVDLPRGRSWWDKALAQNHVSTLEYVAPAYQNGRFGYPVDLLQSKALVARLVEAYRDGVHGVDPDPVKLRRWSDELKYFDRLFELAGGDYQAPVELQQQAEAGDLQAMYQLGRQLLASGLAEQQQPGLAWLERAAEGGHAEAQYKLVISFERQAGIIRSNPARGVALLSAAAEQNHLPAMGALALGYEKGRYGLERNIGQATLWYQRLLKAYDSGSYLGEIDERFIPFNRQRLVYAEKALQAERDKAERYAQASPLERQIIAIEDRYQQQYQAAVNALPRGDGSQEGKLQFRAETQRLLEHYHQLRDVEIDRLKGE